MRNIIFHSIVIDKFRSFRETTTFEMPMASGLIFLTGDNQVEPRLEANGAGKSTLWDALVYCLYGVSVKGMRASDLVSWGEKQPCVTTYWIIDDDELAIERSGSPNKLTINGEPAEQRDVDRLIGLPKDPFLHSVVFGQAVPLLIDLTSPERGALLDAVLDMGLWLKASERAGERSTELSREGEAIAREIAFCQGKLEGAETLAEIEAEIAAWQEGQNERVEAAIKEVEALEAGLSELKPLIAKTSAAVQALPPRVELDARVRSYQTAKAQKEAEYRTLFAAMQAADKRLQFYQHSRVCETCQQTINATFADGVIKQLHREKAQLERQIKTNGTETHAISAALEAMVAEHAKLARKREFLIAQQADAAAHYRAQEQIIEAAVRATNVMIDAPNPHVARYEQAKAEIAAVKARLRQAQRKRANVIFKQREMEFWKAAFKRVRLFMVKRILAQLEIETATAAAALGLVGWRLHYTTELETKSGSLRTGIHIRVASPASSAPWEAYSGGEAQRIRLASALGLASLIQRMAGVKIDFEVWDEPTQHLGGSGIDDLFECLRNRVISTKKAIWVCDHRSLQLNSFDRVYMVTKTESGSHIQLLTNVEE